MFVKLLELFRETLVLVAEVRVAADELCDLCCMRFLKFDVEDRVSSARSTNLTTEALASEREARASRSVT